MTTPSLPATPNPYADELMTSWVERIGLFYGAEYLDTLGLLHAHGPHIVGDPHIDVSLDQCLAQSTSLGRGV